MINYHFLILITGLSILIETDLLPATLTPHHIMPITSVQLS